MRSSAASRRIYLRLSLKQLPFSTPSVLRNGLLEAHRATTTTSWTNLRTTLGQRVSVSFHLYPIVAELCLHFKFSILEFRMTGSSPISIMTRSSSTNWMHQSLHSMTISSCITLRPSPTSFQLWRLHRRHLTSSTPPHKMISLLGTASRGVSFSTSSESTTASHARTLLSVILFCGGLLAKHNFLICFASLVISSLFLVCLQGLNSLLS